MARLYADEDFDYPVVEHLRQLGHDVLTVQEAGQGGQRIPDADVLAFAIAAGRAVVTCNRWDFIKLHAQVQTHAGIVVCTRDADVHALAVRINRALVKRGDLSNQLVRVNLPPAP
jgi:predicted nuclease of predicted toxin-antitoxin system